MNDSMERTCYISNLSAEVTHELIEELCVQVGPVDNIVLRGTGSGRYVFVVFVHRNTVPFAVKTLDGISLFGKKISVRPKTGSEQEQRLTELRSPLQPNQFLPDFFPDSPQYDNVGDALQQLMENNALVELRPDDYYLPSLSPPRSSNRQNQPSVNSIRRSHALHIAVPEEDGVFPQSKAVNFHRQNRLSYSEMAGYAPNRDVGSFSKNPRVDRSSVRPANRPGGTMTFLRDHTPRRITHRNSFVGTESPIGRRISERGGASNSHRIGFTEPSRRTSEHRNVPISRSQEHSPQSGKEYMLFNNKKYFF